jgi:hypothetical protein
MRGMAIEETDDDDGPGQFLYETLQAKVTRLPTSAQMALGMALVRGRDWEELTDEHREAFDAAAAELEL